jgi:hypothetical protein
VLAGAAERVKRLGLPSGAVQRQHQLGVEGLPVRAFGDQGLKLGNQLAMLP